MYYLITTLAFIFNFLQANAGASGTGFTTRYWDCCKPSCAWPGKAALAPGAAPVYVCDINNQPLIGGPAANSSCDLNGNNWPAYACSNLSPWVINDVAYGYAAVKITGGSEATWCCACYALTFTSGPASGKKMIIQAISTGSDLQGNQFDLAIPGGGVGQFNACSNQWGLSSNSLGKQYGGFDAIGPCGIIPGPFQDGCRWRWDWFEGASNPDVTFEQVGCPTELTKNTGCVRADDGGSPVQEPVLTSASLVQRPVPTGGGCVA